MKFSNELSEKIWQQKYCCQDELSCDQSIEESWQRIAEAIASCEKDKAYWQKEFYKILENFQFLPGGRIQAGAGVHKNVTLMNCFVMSDPEDSINGIFDALKEGALTMQYGGGVGYDFSTLRPQGSFAQKAGTLASGPVSFMEIWDKMCEIMLSTSFRRGAMMANLRCDHPDILKFIKSKQQSGKLTNFNLSVLVTDDFLTAVESDKSWPLKFEGKVYKEIPARELWNEIMSSTYEYSEPGVLFVDRINSENNLYYCEHIHATNPCGEVPLPSYGACNLGSLNLTQFIKDPFKETAYFDFEKCYQVLKVAVRFLDNVLDVTQFPLEKQKEVALQSRRIGLGVCGLASALAMLNIRYGTQESYEFVDKLMKDFSEHCYRSSIELAVERGPFPLFDKNQYAESGFASRLPKEFIQEIKTKGIRNSHLMAIAPTGTISLLANNVSSGIEPIFKYKYRRKVVMSEGEPQIFDVEDYAVQLFNENYPGKSLSESFVEADELTPQQHIQMVATFQKYVDQSISKTINVPENAKLEDLQQVYKMANDFGLKGCTTYRPSATRGAILL